MEGEREQQDRERVQQDAEREAPFVIDRPVEARAADAGQQQEVEYQRRRRHRGRLPRRQPAQQQREQARSDVDPLPRVFRVGRRCGHDRAGSSARIDDSVRLTPSCSGVSV